VFGFTCNRLIGDKKVTPMILFLLEVSVDVQMVGQKGDICGVQMVGHKSDAVSFQKCLHRQSTVSKNKKEIKC
jgi:hypothetical protein